MKKRKGTVLMALGLVLMLMALGLTVYNMRTEMQAGETSALVVEQLRVQCAEQRSTATPVPAVTPEVVPEMVTEATDVPYATQTALPLVSLAPDYIRFPEMEMPTVEMDGEMYIGTVEIPELGLVLPVMSEWSYPRLKKAPCRFSGSAYTGDLIVIAHNYVSHFGNLKKLRPGATVRFVDMAGNVFCYEVAETEILKPDQIEALQGTDYPLTLLTCTLGGETRVTVRCDKVMEIPAK